MPLAPYFPARCKPFQSRTKILPSLSLLHLTFLQKDARNTLPSFCPEVMQKGAPHRNVLRRGVPENYFYRYSRSSQKMSCKRIFFSSVTRIFAYVSTFLMTNDCVTYLPPVFFSSLTK